MDQSQDCAAYFKERKAYDRAFTLMRDRLMRGGTVRSSVRLVSPTDEERETFGAFLDRDYRRGEIRFTLNQFAKALASTRFAQVNLEQLLAAYFGEPVRTNREKAAEEEEKKKQFFSSLEKETGGNAQCLAWLHAMQQDKRFGYILLLQVFQQDPERSRFIYRAVCRALQLLEKDRYRLAMLGAAATTDPHVFDRDQSAGRLLIEALSYLHAQAVPASAEELLLLYYESGIRPDDISSFTTVYGVRLFEGETEHDAYAAFWQRRESFVVTLANLERIVRAQSMDGNVYIVENQMVFSHLCEELGGAPASLICTSGRIKSASWVLLDLLARSGAKLHYSGDLDPEGLSIAQKVLRRYPNQASVWHMGAEDYAQAVSTAVLSQRRLRELDAVTEPPLQEVKAAIARGGTAGYQEQLADKLLSDMLHKTNMVS